jgi:hypothetical protein
VRVRMFGSRQFTHIINKGGFPGTPEIAGLQYLGEYNRG